MRLLVLFAIIGCIFFAIPSQAVVLDPETNIVRCFKGDIVCVPTFPMGTITHTGLSSGNKRIEEYQFSLLETTLPASLDHIITESQHYTDTDAYTYANNGESKRERCSHNYEMDYYAVTGMVTTNTYSFDNPYVVHTHYTDTRFIGNSVVTDSDYEKDLVFLFFVDDWADDPSDTNHIGILPVLTNWSFANGYTDSFLHAKRTAVPEELFVAADTDLLAVAGGMGVFCVETKIADGAPAPPLDVKIYTRDGDQYGNLLGGTNAFNVYSANGLIDNVRQRVYYTTTDKEENTVFVRIASTDPAFAGGYGIRVFRARPVILVHGIDTRPWDKDDVKAGPPNRNALGNWEDCLPWDANAYPCVCYNFCWNSYIDPLTPDNKGKNNEIVAEVSVQQDNPSVQKLYERHGHMKVVLLGHSMGGYIVRYALSVKFARDYIHKAVLIASPMYGSDIATIDINWLAARIKHTSKNNLRMLRPGGKFVLAMHSWPGKELCFCIAGVGAYPRISHDTIRGFLTGQAYDRGLWDSDGVVPVSSALMEGANRTWMSSRDHGTIAIATYMDDSDFPMPPTPSLFTEVLGQLFPDSLCNYRRPKDHVYQDEIYIQTREYIK